MTKPVVEGEGTLWSCGEKQKKRLKPDERNGRLGMTERAQRGWRELGGQRFKVKGGDRDRRGA